MSEENLNVTQLLCATVGQLRRALADVPDDTVLCPYSDDDSLVQRVVVVRTWTWEGDWDRVHLIFRAEAAARVCAAAYAAADLIFRAEAAR